MKRYIKASITSSAPDWLKRQLGGRFFGSIKDKLLTRYHIAIDRANFTHEPTSTAAIPIYLLETDYGKEVYCPGANDDDTAYINGRNRKLGSIAKSKLPEMAIDVVYVDPTDSANVFDPRQKYRDPRYSYRYNAKSGYYAGQYQHAKYLGRDENGNEMYEDPKWSPAGMIPSNESRARDKSGYIVPSPEQMLSNYYSKFPERVTDKLDNVYERMVKVRDKLMAADFNKPLDREYGPDVYRDAYRKFSDCIGEYRSLFNYLDANGKIKDDRGWGDASYYIKEFSKKVRDIVSELQEIDKLLG